MSVPIEIKKKVNKSDYFKTGKKGKENQNSVHIRATRTWKIRSYTGSQLS